MMCIDVDMCGKFILCRERLLDENLIVSIKSLREQINNLILGLALNDPGSAYSLPIFLFETYVLENNDRRLLNQKQILKK